MLEDTRKTKEGKQAKGKEGLWLSEQTLEFHFILSFPPPQLSFYISSFFL